MLIQISLKRKLCEYTNSQNAFRFLFVFCVAIFERHSIFPTTYLTIYRFGVLGSSGYKSVKENGFPSGKGRKKLFYTERAVASAFTRRRSRVRAAQSPPVECLDTQTRIGATSFLGFKPRVLAVFYPNSIKIFTFQRKA